MLIGEHSWRGACDATTAQKMSCTNLEAKKQLSRTILTKQVLTKNFSKFVSKYIMHTFYQDSTREIDLYVHSVLSSSTILFSVVMFSLYYLYKLQKSVICTGSEKKTWVVTLILAMKALCDNTYTNLCWEKISGIPLEQLNREERKILAILDYDLTLSESLYFKWLSIIEDHVETFKASQIPQNSLHVQKRCFSRSQISPNPQILHGWWHYCIYKWINFL